MTPLLKFGGLSLALLLISSCSMQRISESAKRADEVAEQASGYAAVSRNQLQPSPRDTVVFSDKPWVSTKPIVAKRGLPISADCELIYRPTSSVGINDIAQYITKECGVNVIVSPDALNPGSLSVGGSAPSASGNATTTATSNPESLSGLLPAGVVGGMPLTAMGYTRGNDFSASTISSLINGIKYSGKASGLLDLATSRLGLSWSYNHTERVIRVNYFETRSFDVYAFGDKQTIESTVRSGMNTSAGVGSGSSSGSSGGTSGTSGSGSGVSGDSGSNQSTKSTLESAILNDIAKSVGSMLSTSPAGRMFLSPSTGTLTVTDRPEVLARIDDFLNTTNNSITQQVLFNVKVFEVTLTDQDQLGLNWAAVYKSLSNKWGLSLSNNVAGISSNAISGSIGIVDTANSAFAGSNVIIQALAEQGRVSNVRSPSVTTLNLQPAPIQIGNVKGYIASTSTTNTSQVGSSTSQSPATITSGFNMTLLPRVMNENEMLVKIDINMSSKPDLQTFTSNGSSVQVPEYDAKSLSPKVKLRSGQTLILSGFDEMSENALKQGAGNPGFWGFGGSQIRTSTHTVLVVLITPILLGQATKNSYFDQVARSNIGSDEWAA
ncbi:type IVB pilus formation outer membrane protein, R64 PilN family [Pseudomonas asturiensis]|uniref:Type IVB pilus formation outer membrane protein, R64 PilN family n=1 Tax=Pseudomonas asturiensis TaxID=1190415 RepID=A0A1M7P7J1_9PSED|nr:PilN family type IVB pilus formation outer membrane protein [Pseudomonas asturiensis]SHN12601.1 type IVB pilus formation outer membrane protein, R64 PilN family [Pseudomonas asturiensis]